MHNQKILAESHEKNTEDRVASLMAELNGFKMTLQSVQENVAILKRAVLQGTLMNMEVSPKIRVSETKSFNGNHDAKELENFIWDMEQFFKAANVLDGEKVSIAIMYLIGNAKLLWRTWV